MTPADLNLTHRPLDAAADDTRAVLQAMHDAVLAQRCLPIWCVCSGTSDFPGLFVARLNISGQGGVYVSSLAVTSASLEAVRAALPEGLVKFDRHPDDAPVILESWL